MPPAATAQSHASGPAGRPGGCDPGHAAQALIYSALGFEVPLFGHVSLILAADHSKLSKRHGATSVGDFQRQGYLPDAMVNFLALLGWNDGSEKEIFTREELVQSFTLERFGPSLVLTTCETEQ